MQLERLRRRSVGFLERDGDTWACFLVTYRTDGGRWKGYFAFRRREWADDGEDELRTADIFVEGSEGEIDRKARGLGRPLLSGLLASALHTRDRQRSDPPHLRTWLRDLVKSNSRDVAGRWEEEEAGAEDRTVSELRSIYHSYRLDQVAHFISLVEPDDFREAVDRILDGETFDFGARDRLQFAMMIVERIEALLPLPSFEVWVEDYLAHPEDYRVYAHTLHREGRLP